MDVQLVVLSACRSSSGREIAGEGAASLTRAFIEAGAKSVLGSIWEVDDRAGSKFIDKFYKGYIGEGLSLTEALKTAQAWLRQQDQHSWSDPYYWAGFQIEGRELMFRH